MTRSAALSVASFGRERKSLRSSTKKVVENVDKNTENDENSSRSVNRSTTREAVTQLQTKSPVKKGQKSRTCSSKAKLEASPSKSIVQVITHTTPKKKLSFDDAQHVSPKKVIDDVKNSPTKKSPTKKTSTKLFRPDVTRFASARRALSTALPDTLVGRTSQLKEMKEFLETNLLQPKKSTKTTKKSTSKPTEAVKKSLYVSGPPGTGKTTCLKHLISTLPESVSCQLTSAFINCMALGNSSRVFAKVAEVILPASKHHLIGNLNETKKLLEEEIVASKKWIVLVLDEIDQLESKCQEVLYTLFEWPYLNNSKLILVGIANALDLTDRILPRISVSRNSLIKFKSALDEMQQKTLKSKRYFFNFVEKLLNNNVFN